MTDATKPYRLAFRTRRRDPLLKKDAVIRTSVELFLEVGYNRATLEEIAKRLNITKPAIYTYFESKDAILSDCYRRALQAAESEIEQVEGTANTGLQQLRLNIHAYMMAMLTDFGRILLLVDDRELSSEAREKALESKRNIDRRFRACIERGIADGSIRRCNAKLTSYAVAGAVNACGRWYDPAGKWTAEYITNELIDTLVIGLKS